MPLFAPLEGSLLAGAALVYLAAMLLLWVQLFFWPTAEEAASGRSPGDWGQILLWGGATLHLGALAGQGPALFLIRAGTVGLFGWILIATYLILGRRAAVGIGAVVTPVALAATFYSLATPRLHAATPPGGFNSFWLVTHVSLIVAAYVALAFAFAASLLYLSQEMLLKRKRLRGLWRRLPSLQVADDWIYRATAFGLGLLTMGFFTGWLYFGLHHPEYDAARDPKVLFSAATWLTFALYMVARFWLGWRGRRANIVVVYGFVLLIISFLGTPHLLQSAVVPH